VVWCLPEYSSGWPSQLQQLTRMPSTISCSSQGRSSAVGVNGRMTRASSGVTAVIARRSSTGTPRSIPPVSDARDFAVDSQRDHNGLEQARHWRVTVTARTDTGPMNKRTQLGDLVFTEACSMVHATGRLSGKECRNSILQKYDPSPYSPRQTGITKRHH
jgi:hypothetical protein